MIENPGFPAKYGHWLKLFVWPVPFTSRPALTAGSISVLKVWKAPNQTTARKLPENPQLGSIIPKSCKIFIKALSLGPRAEVRRHWFCPLVLPSSWWGRCCWWYVGCFQERHLDRAVASKTVAWELAQGITYPLLPDEQWKKTLVVLGYIGDFTTQLYLD